LNDYSLLSKQSVMSEHKTARFLFPNWISVFVGDREGYEAGAPSGSSSEEEGVLNKNQGLSHLHLDGPTSRGQVTSSLFS